MNEEKIRIKQYEQAAGSVSLNGIKWERKWDVCVQCDSRAEADHLRSVLATNKMPTTGNVLMDAYNAMEAKKPQMRRATREEKIDKPGVYWVPVEQEPVAWLYRDSWGTMKLSQVMPPPVGAFPVYTTPPQPDIKVNFEAIPKQISEQEPVAHLWQHSETGRTRIVMPDQIITTDATWHVVGPLYLGAPPRREWVGLTDEELEVLEIKHAPPVHPDVKDDDWWEFARAIEAKLKEKNA